MEEVGAESVPRWCHNGTRLAWKQLTLPIQSCRQLSRFPRLAGAPRQGPVEMPC